MRQIRKLNLHCSPLPLDKLVHLLTATPNCSHLKLTGHLTDEISLPSVKGNVNQITRLKVTSVCTIEHVKFLTKICSQIQHLSISIHEEQLRMIMKYLLSPCNQYTQQLSSLRIQSTGDIYTEKLQDVLTTSRRSKDFSIEDLGYKVSHIWC